jgi:hypothetical protein
MLVLKLALSAEHKLGIAAQWIARYIPRAPILASETD